MMDGNYSLGRFWILVQGELSEEVRDNIACLLHPFIPEAFRLSSRVQRL